MNQWSKIGIVFFLIGTLPIFAAAEEFSYFFEIPASRSEDSNGPLGDYITATLDVADSRRAAKLLAAYGAVDIVDTLDKQIVVGIPIHALTRGNVEEEHLAATFVIDYDEDSVVSSASLMRDSYGASPTPLEIEQFVYDYIEDKNYSADFDFASKVARTRAGDCTEHSVLLAALARAHGLPARLVLGVVLVSGDDNIDAYGHAWTEVYFEDAWLRLDGTAPATLQQNEESYYLPLMTLDDEGPGYGMDFLRLISVHPARISEIQAAKP